MFIETLKISYPKSGWQLEETQFGPLNLLVGASGVGKTRILEGILDMVKISVGSLRSPDLAPIDEPISWRLTFRNNADELVEWSGEIEEQPSSPPANISSPVFSFTQERIVIAGKTKAERIPDGILFEGNKIPKLTSLQSLMRLFLEDSAIKNAVFSLRRVIEVAGFDFQYKRERGNGRSYSDIHSIRASNENLIFKLYSAYLLRGDDPTWNEVLEEFRGIFPTILGLDIHTVPFVEDGKEWYLFDLEFEEAVVGRYPFYEMSEGMLKTFEIIATLHLCPDKSLILIDEFENSLGPNCIDLVADSVNLARRQLQFVITSHHPYVINRIPMKNWKIVTRQGATVRTHTAEELGIGRSRHESYDQLVQLDAYQTGQFVR